MNSFYDLWFIFLIVLAILGCAALVFGNIILYKQVFGEIDTNGNILPDKIPYPKCIHYSDGTLSIVQRSCDGSYQDITWLIKNGYTIDTAIAICTDCWSPQILVFMSR